MRISPLIIATIFCATSGVYANFHVGRVTLGIGGASFYHRVCSSNNYNCECFAGAGSGRDANLPSGQSQLQTYFQVKSGLCGAPLLDFYKKSDGSWDFYHNNGDGKVKGTCYSNSARIETCFALGTPQWTYTDKLVCYSSICG